MGLHLSFGVGPVRYSTGGRRRYGRRSTAQPTKITPKMAAFICLFFVVFAVVCAIGSAHNGS